MISTVEQYLVSILMVEDNPVNRDMLGRRLTRHGFQLAYASDRATALEESRSRRPDLILMDIGLGEDNGLEITQQIRAHPFGRYVPIIALTAHATAADREKCLAAGCDDFETKPIEFERLLGKVLRYVVRGDDRVDRSHAGLPCNGALLSSEIGSNMREFKK